MSSECKFVLFVYTCSSSLLSSYYDQVSLFCFRLGIASVRRAGITHETAFIMGRVTNEMNPGYDEATFVVSRSHNIETGRPSSFSMSP